MAAKKSIKSSPAKGRRKSKQPRKLIKKSISKKNESVLEYFSKPKPQSTASAKVKVTKEDNNNDIINNNAPDMTIEIDDIEISVTKNKKNNLKVDQSNRDAYYDCIPHSHTESENDSCDNSEDATPKKSFIFGDDIDTMESDEEEIDAHTSPVKSSIAAKQFFVPSPIKIPSTSKRIPENKRPKRQSKTASKLPKERKKEKKRKQFPCKSCGEVFPNRYFLRKHNLMTHDDSVYECRVCAFTSVEPEKLKNHILKLHVAKKEKPDKVSIEQMQEELESLIERKMPRKLIMEDGVTLGRDLQSKLRYACDLCSRIYSSKFALERHVRCHTLEKPYKCEVCDFQSSYKEHLNRHMMNVHLIVHSNEPQLKYIQKRKAKSEPEDSQEDISENNSEEVPLMGPSQVSVSNTGEITFPKQKRRSILRKRFECAVCGMKATHKSDLTDHIRANHPNAHIESLKNVDGSFVHLIVTASKQQKVSKKLTIECEYCSLMFHDTWKYRVHLRSHTGVKPFKCSECDLRATSKMTIRDHIHRKHPNADNPKIYLRTVGIDGEINEIEMPVPFREFKCEYCHQKMKDNYTLKIHKQKEHKDELPFQCAICGHNELTKACMLIHCMSHHKEHPLDKLILRNGRPMKIGPVRLPSCEICNKLFSYKSQLYYHMRQHTGERTFACDHCEYKTNLKSSLNNHIKTKHLPTRRLSPVKSLIVPADDKIEIDVVE